MALATDTSHIASDYTGDLRTLSGLVERAAWGARLAPCSSTDVERMRAASDAVQAVLDAGEPVYGLTQGFGPLVVFEASSEAEQGRCLIDHLGTSQGIPLTPEVCRLVMMLRLDSMRRGYSAVAPHRWQPLADLWNAGFTPAIPREGTVSASGDLQPLGYAALACAGSGEVWAPDGSGRRLVPAGPELQRLGFAPVSWPVREALAFVNGTGTSLGLTIANHQSALRLVRVVAALSGRILGLLGGNPEHYADGLSVARGQLGQRHVAAWCRDELPAGATRDRSRPLQEPYSLRCAPQVLGAALDQIGFAASVLAREAAGCTDNPASCAGEVLHGGNFHAMPVGFASEQLGLAVHAAAYLAERQLHVLVTPQTNGGLPIMLTPRAGDGCGLAGVQISATAFVSRIRQLVQPASLTALPTNGWNQDHVPMALNGANGVADALELAWLVVGSLGVAVAQLTAIGDGQRSPDGVWAELASLSPPLGADRPLAGEVRQAGLALQAHAAELVGRL